ncbi:hypothetical protein HMSSN036_89520 [Paenibacillus macerans]|nr:hypothetical protein HMSSN036_89520 [Paenibacillus macerans]
MREAGRILAECHQGIARLIGPGITTLEIDRFVESFLAERGATPEQKGYRGFRLRPALPSTTSLPRVPERPQAAGGGYRDDRHRGQ